MKSCENSSAPLDLSISKAFGKSRQDLDLSYLLQMGDTPCGLVRNELGDRFPL